MLWVILNTDPKQKCKRRLVEGYGVWVNQGYILCISIIFCPPPSFEILFFTPTAGGGVVGRPPTQKGAFFPVCYVIFLRFSFPFFIFFPNSYKRWAIPAS